MLLNFPNENTQQVKIQKYLDRKDVSKLGAFSGEDKIKIVITVSRRLAATGVFLEITDDNTGLDKTVECTFSETNCGNDVYFVHFDFKKMCPDGDDLLFWRLCVKCGDRTLYTQSINNVDYYLTDNKADGKKFRLLVYGKDYETPLWAKKSVMYQIFVDRFNKGTKKIPCRDDAVIIEDWENGIPEYPPYCGAPMKNNSFFGGNLYGVIEKLDYLQSLGVNLLYFCPIFKAYSNHKYDTGDYEKVDEMFGGDAAFVKLVDECNKRSIRIILDGVFNHTGDDSKYFNRYGKYKNAGAYQSKKSKYSDWYTFTQFPDKYEAWWGIEILPRINGDNPKVRDYFLSEKGIVRKWLKKGISGWRLDVADELSQGFLEELRSAAKTEKNDSLIIGEVWENAADKVSYDQRRRYFRGKQLDSVMNYPIKNAIIDFVKWGNAEQFYNSVTEIYSSYPDFCSSVLMNILGTHDTERILTVLGGKSGEGVDNETLSTLRMNEEERKRGKKMLKIASVLQFTLPGIPSIYYGDEAGLEGYHDPFCRFPYPWGREDEEILCHYRKLCKIKGEEVSLHNADMNFICKKNGLCVFERGFLTIAVNASGGYVTLDVAEKCKDLITDDVVCDTLTLSPVSAVILKKI